MCPPIYILADLKIRIVDCEFEDVREISRLEPKSQSALALPRDDFGKVQRGFETTLCTTQAYMGFIQSVS
jgi:hypothetical protein